MSVRRAVEASARLLFSLREMPVALVVFLSLLFVLRSALFPGASEDDAEQIFFAQVWAWGYKPNQPPLFTWLVRMLETGFGPGVAVVEAVKFAALLAFYGFSLASARRLIEDRRLAVLGALAPFAFYYVGWDAVVNYSHSVLLLAAAAASLWALVRLEEDDGIRRYAVLGLAIGAGLLAKYNFLLVLAGLLVGGVAHPGLRGRVLSPRFAAALLTATLVAAPHLHWAMTDPGGLAAVAGGAKPWPEAASRWSAAVSGMWSLAKGSVAFVLPWLVFAVVFHPRLLRRRVERRAPGLRFLEGYLLAVLGVAAGLVLVLGVTEIQNHWLAALFPAPLWLMARLEGLRGGAGEAGPRRLAAVTTLLALAVPVVLFARFATGPLYCKKCNFFLPWEAVAADLREAGFAGGTVVTFDYPNQLSGNLRRHMPDARFTSERFASFVAPRAAAGDCLVVWNEAVVPEGYGRVAALRWANEALDAGFPDDTPPTGRIEASVARSDGRTLKLGYVLAKGGVGNCR